MNIRINVNNNEVFIKIIQLIITIITILISLIIHDNVFFIGNWEIVITILCFILFIEELIMLRFLHYKLFSFETFFIILMHLFMFGRVIAYAFDIKVGYFLDSRIRFDKSLLFHASLYILCSISCLFYGLVINHKRIDYNNIYTKRKKYSNELLFKSGLIVLTISLFCKLYIDIQYIYIAQSTGIYTSTSKINTVGIIDDFSWLIIPGFYYIVASNKINKKAGIIIGILIIMYMLTTSILTGIRRFQMSAIIAVFLFMIDYYEIKINLIRLSVFSIFSYFLCVILKAIRYMRFSGLTNLAEFAMLFSTYNMGLYDTFWETLTEFGASFFSICNILVYIPKFHFYQLGLYFIYCILNILPIGFLVGSFMEGSLSAQANLHTNLGVGGSLFTDMYANFGLLGVLGSFIVGILIEKSLYLCGKRFEILKEAQYYTLVFAFIVLVRGSLQETIRFAVWGIYIPIIIMNTIKRLENK